MENLTELNTQLNNKNFEIEKIKKNMQKHYNNLFRDNETLDRIIIQAENLEGYDYIYCNDINGVDYYYGIEHITNRMSKDEREFLINYLDDLDINVKNIDTNFPAIFSSTSDEIFILDDRNGRSVLTPNGSKVPCKNNHHAFLIAEKWRVETGIFCGLFEVNNYDGTCDNYKPSILEKNIMAYAGSKKETLEKLDQLLFYYHVQDEYSLLDEEFGPYFELTNSTYEVSFDPKTKRNSVVITYKITLEDIKSFNEEYQDELIKKYDIKFFHNEEYKEASLIKIIIVEF